MLTSGGYPEAAEALASQALEALRAAMAPDSWRIADAESVCGGCPAAQGRFAEELLVRGIGIARDFGGDWAPYTRDAARRLMGER